MCAGARSSVTLAVEIGGPPCALRSPVRASLGAHGVASVPQCGLQAPDQADLSVCGARHDAWNHAWTMWFTFKLKVWAPTTARLESNHGHGLLV